MCFLGQESSLSRGAVPGEGSVETLVLSSHPVCWAQEEKVS